MVVPFLKQGSKVGIVAPARRVTPDEMAYGIQWLKEQDFVPVYDDRLFAVHHIFAGTDEVITFSHRVYSRAVFGKGAVEAAKYLAGKPAGLYTMHDVLA